MIEEGALADIRLVNGDSLKDITILTKPEENLVVIMKDGKIYKNTLRCSEWSVRTNDPVAE